MKAPNFIENKTEKVNLSTSNTIPHIILSADGLKNPIHMMIDTGAGSNLIKQQAVKTNVKINKFECLKLTGINEHPVFTLGQITINIFGYSTTLNIIPNEVPIENDGILGRGEAAKLAHLIESASLKRKYMTKNYEKLFI